MKTLKIVIVTATVITTAVTSLGGMAWHSFPWISEIGTSPPVPSPPPAPPPPPPLPLIARIQALSDLATLRVRIADTITGRNDHWEVRWILHGEAVLGVNMAQAQYLSIDEEHRKATLSLPACHVISSKVDHHRSEELSAKRLSWIPSPGLQSLRDDVWGNADEKVYRLAQHEDYLDTTRLQTERALCQLFQGVGWDIDYEWRSNEAEPPKAEALVEASP